MDSLGYLYVDLEYHQLFETVHNTPSTILLLPLRGHNPISLHWHYLCTKTVTQHFVKSGQIVLNICLRQRLRSGFMPTVPSTSLMASIN